MKRIIYAIAAGLILPAVILASVPSKRPLTLAHRGANLEADENTMAAFELAADYGVDMVETDPRMTADGKWVVMHDPTVDRTTDGTGEIAKMTLAQIKQLKTVPSGHEVPTLDEILEFAHKRGVGVYLDMKIIPPDWAAFIKFIDSHGMKDKVILGLWWKQAVRDVEGNWPEMVTCISWPKPVVTLEGVKKLHADYVGTLNSLASKWMIKRAHKLGLKVVTMPLDTEQDLLKFKNRGLDILQTDDPRLLKNLEPAGAEYSPWEIGPRPYQSSL